MHRLQQNLPLKMIALITSIMLFFYVQAERNPALSRPMNLPIALLNKPADADIETDVQQVAVTVSGPRPIVESLKDSDIRVIADLKNLKNPNSNGPKSVPLRYDKSSLSDEKQAQITIEPATPASIHVSVFPQTTRTFTPLTLFPTTPRPGFIYKSPDLKPAQIKVTGRVERVSLIKRLVVNADPTTPGGEIDGDFPVTPHDKDGNIVENVTVIPDTIHVQVALREEPYPKIVTVSPNIVDQPPPGYQLRGISVTPNQLRVVGRPENVQPISTIVTDPISISNFTGTQTVQVNLRTPPKVTVTDLATHALSSVKVRIELEAIPRLAPNSGDVNPTKPPEDSGTTSSQPDALRSPLNPHPKNSSQQP